MENTGRNKPCPCGSGKKYKYCCSPSAINALGDKISLFERNRDVAYAGPLGQRRKDLCQEYELKKEAIFEELRRRTASSAPGKISCASGCHHCCLLLAGATIQEVELIVRHLYRNEELLTYFINAYPRWLSRLKEVSSLLRAQSETGDKEVAHHDCAYLLSISIFQKWKVSNENRKVFSKWKLYCPFLREGKCSIYEVRPFYCAGYAAITPGEWCDPSHPDYLKRRANQAFETGMADDLSYFTGKLVKPVWSFMPPMVYDTLKFGCSALQKMKIIRLS